MEADKSGGSSLRKRRISSERERCLDGAVDQSLKMDGQVVEKGDTGALN